MQSLPPRLLEAAIVQYAVIPVVYTDPRYALSLGLDPTSFLPMLTDMFMHGGWMHLIFNMWFLWIFGPAMERRFGSLGFLALYVAGGLTANVVHIATHIDSTEPVIGASGAVAAVIAAYAVTYPWARVLSFVPLGFIPLIFPLPAFLFAFAWFGMQLLQGSIELTSSTMAASVAWWAHIGGFVFGALGRARRAAGRAAGRRAADPHCRADFPAASVPGAGTHARSIPAAGTPCRCACRPRSGGIAADGACPTCRCATPATDGPFDPRFRPAHTAADKPGGKLMVKIDAATAVSRRRVLRNAATLAIGVAAPSVLRVGRAFAAYPDRVIKIVVPNTPGGPSDIIARILAASLQAAIGNSVVVENKGGGGSNIGMGAVARADGDGYTLLLATSAYSVNPGLYETLPYDPFKDFAAIAELATSPNVFAVKPELGVGTMKDFIALAKKDPARFNVSTPPVGTTPQLEAEVLKSREGLGKMATVVFAGGGEAIQALLSNTVQLSSGVLAPAHPLIKSGTVKGLAVTGETRWHDLPDIPTMAEAGFPDFVFETYTALLAPVKTPPEIVARLEKETLAILTKPEMRERLVQSGFQVQAKTGKEHMARVAREVPMYRNIVAQAKIEKLH